jgi:uncharacterized protein
VRDTTNSTVERRPFTRDSIKAWENKGGRYVDWPAVYTLNDRREVYVGETLSVTSRMRQHLANPEKAHLKDVRVVLHSDFNKSAALDLESFLIQRFAGDGQFTVLNRNDGVTNADYFDRPRYEAEFERIFEDLRQQGLFVHTLDDIENSDLFKLSPFKSLNGDQLFAINNILAGLFQDLRTGTPSTIAVQGDPGTGKTVVGIFLMKVLQDIKAWSEESDGSADDADSPLAQYFTAEHSALLQGFTMGLVIPQQSLRKSVAAVFRKTPGLHPSMVLTPFSAAKADEHFDLLIVDETHRLTQRANQASGPLNKDFAEVTEKLFGDRNDHAKTQVDWIKTKSTHQLFLMDVDQTVRPADVPRAVLEDLATSSRSRDRYFELATQMRVRGGSDYIQHAKRFLLPETLTAPLPDFGEYDFKVFSDLGEMRAAILEQERKHGLSRLLSGYGFEWKSQRDKAAADIELDGQSLRWNGTTTDWVSSPGSIDEVGSIHTIQGYDLNYAGVIIAPEVRFDPASGQVRLDRDSYFDKKGKENSKKLDRFYSDEDVLAYVRKVYGVLLTRGMLGTYVYAATPELRAALTEAWGSAHAH